MAETNQWMIDPKDAVMLLIDHQSGLFQLVKDIELPVLRNNVIALAKVSRLAKIPTFTTASVPDGPNGPLIPEIHQSNPDALYIPRTGQINAWDNPAWVEAIRGTKRKTLLIAGEPGFGPTPSGQRGSLLRAYDKRTGADAGALFMPAPQTGSPMTYLLNGKQYLVVAISGGSYSGELLAFALPD